MVAIETSILEMSGPLYVCQSKPQVWSVHSLSLRSWAGGRGVGGESGGMHSYPILLEPRHCITRSRCCTLELQALTLSLLVSVLLQNTVCLLCPWPFILE